MQVLVANTPVRIAQSILSTRQLALLPELVLREKRVLCSPETSRPAARLIKASVKRISEAFCSDNSNWEVKPSTHLQLVSKLRMSGVIPPLPSMSSCCECKFISEFQECNYFYNIIKIWPILL